MPEFSSIVPSVSTMIPQANPTFSVMPPMAPNSPANPGATGYAGPTWADVLRNLSGVGSTDVLEDPAYKTAFDRLRSNADFYGTKAASEAQALASRRGQTGSSTEQFGTQTALDNVNRNYADQAAQLQLQELARRQTLGMKAADLTSDEMASLRNAYFSDQNLDLQKSLGGQQLDIARQNIEASKDIARQQSQFGLIGSIGSAFLPGLLSKSGLFGGGGGGGGLFSGLFGGGGGAGGGAAAAGGIPGLQGGAPLVGGAIPGAGGFFGGMGAVPGLAAMAGAGYLSSQISSATNPIMTKMFGQTQGDLANYFLNPIGSTINFGKKLISDPGKTVSNAVGNVGSSVSKAVKSVFPF